MNMKKVLALALALVLIVGATVAGTVAWLMASTDPVTNTFTTSDIDITLTETTNDYKIIPGGKDTKDPKVTVKSGSEECYVYVLVENNLVLGENVVGTPNIDTANWNAITTNGTKTLYRYKAVVDAAEADVVCPVFTEVSYSETITKADMTALANKTIVITAFAHQSENTTQEVADAAAKAHFGLTP